MGIVSYNDGSQPDEERDMITDPDLLKTFEHDQIRRAPADYHRNVRIVQSLCREARLLGVWPPQNPLDGLESDLRLARALNVHRNS